jgi:hypothetical protein
MQSAEMRAKAETMLQQADKLLCESWNERTWSDGGPVAGFQTRNVSFSPQCGRNRAKVPGTFCLQNEP